MLLLSIVIEVVHQNVKCFYWNIRIFLIFGNNMPPRKDADFLFLTKYRYTYIYIYMSELQLFGTIGSKN